MIFLSVSTIGSVFGVSNLAAAGAIGGTGRRGSISGNCAVLYAHAASTCAPWLMSSFQTLSNVSDWLWCVLKYSAISCAHQHLQRTQRRDDLVHNLSVLIVVVQPDRQHPPRSTIVNQRARNLPKLALMRPHVLLRTNQPLLLPRKQNEPDRP